MKKLRRQIKKWSGAPPMSSGVPMPAIRVSENRLYVAYLISDAELADEIKKKYAVVRFDGVLQHTFGYPNDEALGGHPLYSAGLRFYEFTR